MRKLSVLVTVLALSCLACSPLKRFAYEGFSRDSWQQPDRVIEALGLEPGDHVADLGSGSGYFTLRLAQAVGPTGKVYAVDVDEAMNDYLRERVHDAELERVGRTGHLPSEPSSKIGLVGRELRTSSPWRSPSPPSLGAEFPQQPGTAARHCSFDPRRRTQVSRRGPDESMKAGSRTPPRAAAGRVVRARSAALAGRDPATSRSPESPAAV